KVRRMRTCSARIGCSEPLSCGCFQSVARAWRAALWLRGGGGVGGGVSIADLRSARRETGLNCFLACRGLVTRGPGFLVRLPVSALRGRTLLFPYCKPQTRDWSTPPAGGPGCRSPSSGLAADGARDHTPGRSEENDCLEEEALVDAGLGCRAGAGHRR
ncbi:hypothetical protein P7K49_005584, partial [Saguinus oedipus]